MARPQVESIPERLDAHSDVKGQGVVVAFVDSGSLADATPWLAMELVAGDSLRAELERLGRIEPTRALKLMLQVLDALQAAHAQSVLHRDLKPSNIMLSLDAHGLEQVKLVDFGVAKAVGDSEEAIAQDLTGVRGDAYGTPRYLAPEILCQQPLGPFTDVYATALILFEMLVGEPAIVGENLYEILARQISTPVDLPPWLDVHPLGAVLRRAAAKDPRQRYADAQAFASALRAIPLDGLSPPPLVSPSARAKVATPSRDELRAQLKVLRRAFDAAEITAPELAPPPLHESPAPARIPADDATTRRPVARPTSSARARPRDVDLDTAVPVESPREPRDTGRPKRLPTRWLTASLLAFAIAALGLVLFLLLL